MSRLIGIFIVYIGWTVLKSMLKAATKQDNHVKKHTIKYHNPSITKSAHNHFTLRELYQQQNYDMEKINYEDDFKYNDFKYNDADIFWEPEESYYNAEVNLKEESLEFQQQKVENQNDKIEVENQIQKTEQPIMKDETLISDSLGFSKDNILNGLIMAEVLGPPKAKRLYIK